MRKLALKTVFITTISLAFGWIEMNAQESKITIIPLKNTLQPSGQSVALQSMANGTPVLISKTDGSVLSII